MRTRFQVPLLLVVTLGFTHASGRPARVCFSEPQSILLFSGENGDLNLVTPSEKLIVPHLHGWAEQHASPLPAISPSGRPGSWEPQIYAECGHGEMRSVKIKEWCDPNPRPIFKSVMGVYSVARQNVEAIRRLRKQLDRRHFRRMVRELAFKVDNHVHCGANCDQNLMILDLETGQMTPVPGAESSK